jgi:hypothetical protein
MKTVTFTNVDAVPLETTVEVSEASIPHILAWYNAYHGGDTYAMTVDGELVPTFDGEIL